MEKHLKLYHSKLKPESMKAKPVILSLLVIILSVCGSQDLDYNCKIIPEPHEIIPSKGSISLSDTIGKIYIDVIEDFVPGGPEGYELKIEPDGTAWRLEIDAYPELTDNVDSYSKDEVREIIQYASDRFIIIIPDRARAIDQGYHNQGWGANWFYDKS